MNTNFTKMETIELDFEEKSLEELNEIATENNLTIDEVVRHILIDQFSKVIESADIGTISDEVLLSNYWIVTENGVPKARIIPIS
jgi:uncharacterized coiled-coil protein SlyX